ncbi:MAG: hypothetical protein KGJ88_07155 [Verrucomicrobiota bacterium]|nr:hypothetical protein [Verrucomicrobiota bacterium]
MNETTLKERTEKLLEIDKIIKRLDATIRPAAFSLLQDYVLAGVAAGKEKSKAVTTENLGSEGREGFFSKFNHDKPSDNVLLLCAYHFSQYGSAAFTTDEISDLANEVGVTIPNHPAMTIKAAQRKGKSLFRIAGRGLYAPTVHGESFFKATYKVSKGTQQKPQPEE